MLLKSLLKVKSVMVDDMYDGEAIGINIDNIVDFSVTLQKKFDDNKLTKKQIQALEAIPIINPITKEEETFKFTRKEK